MADQTSHIISPQNSTPQEGTAAVQAVLFDYGMVLSRPANSDALAAMLQTTGADEPTFQTHYWAYRDDYDRGTLNAEHYWRKVAEGALFPLDVKTLHALKTADIRMWSDLNAPMVEWAEALAAAGYRTGILSNIGDGMSPAFLENFAWLKSFHHLTWSWELKLAKPEEAIYLHAAQGLGCRPQEVLFIDDKAENIEAAMQAGLHAILYAGHEPGGHDAFLREMRRRGVGYLLSAMPTAD